MLIQTEMYFDSEPSCALNKSPGEGKTSIWPSSDSIIWCLELKQSFSQNTTFPVFEVAANTQNSLIQLAGVGKYDTKRSNMDQIILLL